MSESQTGHKAMAFRLQVLSKRRILNLTARARLIGNLCHTSDAILIWRRFQALRPVMSFALLSTACYQCRVAGKTGRCGYLEMCRLGAGRLHACPVRLTRLVAGLMGQAQEG